MKPLLPVIKSLRDEAIRVCASSLAKTALLICFQALRERVGVWSVKYPTRKIPIIGYFTHGLPKNDTPISGGKMSIVPLSVLAGCAFEVCDGL